jgi:hypothetical protein
MYRKHPFDRDQLEIVFHQLIEVLERLEAMGGENRGTPQYSDALGEFIDRREELGRQLDAIEASFS